jgi:hypothetical protein
MPQKNSQKNDSERLRNWYKTRFATLLRLSGEPSKTLCIDEVNLTICCRYAETLLKNSRIRRYLLNNHSEELQRLERLLDDFRRESGL